MNAKLTYQLSEAGRKADVLAGGTGSECGELILTHGDADFARAVDVGIMSSNAVTVNGTARIGYGDRCVSTSNR